MQLPNYGKWETEHRNISKDVDDRRSQVEGVLIDTATRSLRFPKLINREALENEAEEIGEVNSRGDEGYDQGAQSETRCPLKYTPVEKKDADLDGEDAGGPYHHVHPEKLATRTVSLK